MSHARTEPCEPDELLDAWNALPVAQWPPSTSVPVDGDYWVIYARISADPIHTLEGVRNQILQVLRTQVRERHGWPGAVVLRIDNDVAASKAHVIRPAYRKVLDEDVPGGRCVGVAVYALDRFYRRLLDLEDIIDVFNAASIPVASYSGSTVDLSTREGRTFARIVAALARSEIEAIEERLRSWHRQAALDGKPIGKPGFGYSAGMTVVEPEAQIIRWIAEQLLQGMKLHTLASALNEMGIRTSDAGRMHTNNRTKLVTPVSGLWYGGNLKTFILKERLIGWRMHKGVVANRAAWEPVLDEITHQRLKATLNSEARSVKFARGPARVHLLTGLIVCGRCRSDGKTILLTARNKFPSEKEKARGVEPFPIYICLKTRGGCNGLVRECKKVDDVVEQWARQELHASAVRVPSLDNDAEVSSLSAAIANDEQMLMEYSEDRTAKRITREQFLAATQQISARISGNRERLAAQEPMSRLQGEELSATLLRWDNLGVARRHELIRSIAAEVVLLPATRRGAPFEPTTVVPVLRAKATG
ncbi:MAG: recombinase family protein [Acidimicrobiales bacterium]